jgi:hypothetical protein
MTLPTPEQQRRHRELTEAYETRRDGLRSAIAARPGLEERLARLLDDHQEGALRVGDSSGH